MQSIPPENPYVTATPHHDSSPITPGREPSLPFSHILSHLYPSKSPNLSTYAIGTTSFPSPSQSPFLLTPVNTANVPPNPPSIPNRISVSSRSPTMHARSRRNRNLPSMASIIFWLGLPIASGSRPTIFTNGALMLPAPGNSARAFGSVLSPLVARKTAPRWM